MTPELSAQLVDRLRSSDVVVPPYPAVATAIAKIARDQHSNLRKVISMVAADPALAATVLRAAGSAHQRTGAPSTLDAAVWKLGVEGLLRVVMTSTIGGTASVPGPLAVLRRDLWRRSLLSAVLCRELAGRRMVASEEAFLAGLLHDFGAMVVLACLESPRSELPTLPEASWRALVDELHVEFGLIVAARWGLSDALTEVVTRHHDPQTAQEPNRPLVQLVAMVDDIIAIHDRPGGNLAALAGVPGLDDDARMRIGALIPRVADQMAAFEGPAGRDVRSAVIRSTTPESWPIDITVTGRNQTQYRAYAINATSFALRGDHRLEPGWLADLVLALEPEPLALLVNVITCEARPEGGYDIIAQPYALADATRWQQIVAGAQFALARRLS